MIVFNILDKFFKEGAYTSTKKTITILKKEVIEEETAEVEKEIEVIDFETYTIGEFYVKRTYTYDEYGNPTISDETNYGNTKTQREKYDFLKNLMLDFAGELSKNPAEAFAVKSNVEDLKFWAELGSAEAVMFTLSSIEDNAIFTPETKALLIGKIQNFLAT